MIFQILTLSIWLSSAMIRLRSTTSPILWENHKTLQFLTRWPICFSWWQSIPEWVCKPISSQSHSCASVNRLTIHRLVRMIRLIRTHKDNIENIPKFHPWNRNCMNYQCCPNPICTLNNCINNLITFPSRPEEIRASRKDTWNPSGSLPCHPFRETCKNCVGFPGAPSLSRMERSKIWWGPSALFLNSQAISQVKIGLVR
jgi:hypothetical protein